MRLIQRFGINGQIGIPVANPSNEPHRTVALTTLAGAMIFSTAWFGLLMLIGSLVPRLGVPHTINNQVRTCAAWLLTLIPCGVAAFGSSRRPGMRFALLADVLNPILLGFSRVFLNMGRGEPDSMTLALASASTFTLAAVAACVGRASDRTGRAEFDEYAFSDCSALTGIGIPEGVTEIRHYTFLNCISLTGAELPASVTAFKAGAFMGC